MSTDERLQALVVGGGPAGLATSAELKRRGIAHAVLERGDAPGHSWINLYDSLTLHTGKHLSTLPGTPFAPDVPLFPTRQHFVDYLHRYAAAHQLPIRTGCAVERLERDGSGWVARALCGDYRAEAIVMATGISASPRVPAIPGRERYRGRVMHSIEYRRPDGFAGRRVLVVGVGNSGGEIGSELAGAGAKVTVSVRSGANVVPRQIAGIPIQYLSFAMHLLPRPMQRTLAKGVGKLTELRRGKPVLPRPAHSPLDSIPLIGFHLVDAIRSGQVAVRGGLVEFTEAGVRFADGSAEAFDDVILATGFTAAIGPLGDLVRVDARGFARRADRVTSADQPNLYFVGHNYDSTGGLYNIRRDSQLAAARIAGALNRRAA